MRVFHLPVYRFIAINHYTCASPSIIILLSSICTWFVTRRALTPLRRFSDRIRQVQAQNLSEPLEVPLSEDEISRLTRSFNDMLARLDNAFSAQKRFVASAAH